MPYEIVPFEASLDNLGRGEVIERFNEEFQKAIRNILDTRTPARKRAVVIKLELEPLSDEDRHEIRGSIGVENKLLSPSPYCTRFQIELGISGKVEAREKVFIPEEDIPEEPDNEFGGVQQEEEITDQTGETNENDNDQGETEEDDLNEI